MNDTVQKYEITKYFLDKGLSVFIHLNGKYNKSGLLRLPLKLHQNEQVVLQIGKNMSVPIPDLIVDEYGICATLSFNGRPFKIDVPWDAIYGIVDETGYGKTWQNHMPKSVIEHMQKAKEEIASLSEEPEQEIAPINFRATFKDKSGNKRNLPDYMRIVK